MKVKTHHASCKSSESLFIWARPRSIIHPRKTKHHYSPGAITHLGKTKKHHSSAKNPRATYFCLRPSPSSRTRRILPHQIVFNFHLYKNTHHAHKTTSCLPPSLQLLRPNPGLFSSSKTQSCSVFKSYQHTYTRTLMHTCVLLEAYIGKNIYDIYLRILMKNNPHVHKRTARERKQEGKVSPDRRKMTKENRSERKNTERRDNTGRRNTSDIQHKTGSSERS